MVEPVLARGDHVPRFLTFQINHRLYALPAEEVAEVIRIPPVARVPLGPRSLLGLANLRGAVLPVASLRQLLGQDQEAAESESNRAIVLHGAVAMALTVDRVLALVEVEAERLETRQMELSAEPGELLRGAFATGAEKAAKVLDVQALLATAFASSARAPKPARAAPTASPMQGSVAQAEQCERLVTFEIAGQEYAFELASVREIIVFPDSLTVNPRSESIVLGVSAYRETLLPLLSLRGLLGFPPAEMRDGREKVVIVGVRGVFVGLLVDRMRSILAAEPHLMEPPSALLAARCNAETQIKAVYRGGAGQRLVSVLSPEQLFREDVMGRLTSSGDLPQAVAAPLNEARVERKFLVFRLGEDEFGLPIEAVHEVTRVPDQITRVPKTPAFLEGVVNLRGEVLPVIDQRKRFDMPILVSGGSRLIVVRSAQFHAGLIVDSVSGVLGCIESAIEAAPDFAGAAAQLVNGVINLEQAGRMVLLLDPGELLSNAERGLLESLQAETKQAETKQAGAKLAKSKQDDL
jgi:purine-binding chemotaxis protein CheW